MTDANLNTEGVLRDLNAPGVELGKTSADETLVRSCPGCGGKVTLVVPAGTPVRVARYVAGLTPECDACGEKREAVERMAEARRLRRQRAGASELPPNLRGVQWDACAPDGDHPNSDRALEAARAWASLTGRKRGLYVSGPVGVGKTTLAAAAAWELLLRRDVRYVSVPDLIIRLGAAFSDADRARALKVLTGRGALVLDDLDKIKPSTNTLTHLYTAIDNRYQARAPLFVTANLKPAELVAYFAGPEDDGERRAAAEAIVSRLMEHCVVGWIGGPDRRRV